MLKIAHIADTHLGYRSNTIPGRDEDFATSWITACRDIVEAKPDLILHAGDVFHRPHPSWGAVSHFLAGAAILEEANIPIFMISGNHDSSRVTTKHTVFSVLAGAVPFITISYNDKPEVHSLAELDAVVVLLSHQALLSRSLRADLVSTLSSLSKAKFKILVSHGGVGDLETYQEMGSVVIPDFVFDYPWSYIALGHLHIAQPFGSKGWYSGSIERCGWSDFPAEPAWTNVTIFDRGRVRRVQRPLPHMPMIQLPDIQAGGVEELNIVAEILEILTRTEIPPERSVARIKLLGVHLYARHSIQSIIQRTAKELYPNLTIQVDVESTSILKLPKEIRPREDMESIEEMFVDFVASRTFEDESIREKLRETGTRAIAVAREQEQEKTAY